MYCFVHIEDVGSLPKFFLVKSKDVAKYVREQHVFYQKIPREKPVKDGSMRQFRIDVNDPNGDNWVCTRVIEDIVGAELHRKGAR